MGKPIYSSADGGVTWQPAEQPDLLWDAIASSADGSKLVAAAYGDIYTSIDSGTSWTLTFVWPTPFSRWGALAISADGTRAVAALHWATSGFQYVPGPIYISTNSGANWALTGAPNMWWTAAACSADASKVVAAGESVYTSTNSGATGTTYSSPSTDWASVASSADGNKLMAAVNGGGIYTSQSTPAPALSITASGGTLLLSWTMPSMPFVLQDNPDLTTTNWIDVTNAPTLNLTNLQNQVTLPAPTGNRFYRLKQ